MYPVRKKELEHDWQSDCEAAGREEQAWQVFAAVSAYLLLKLQMQAASQRLKVYPVWQEHIP
jgi:hypothetical protein